MADAITIKALQDASLDAKSLEEVVNGDENVVVTTRLGETYPSVKSVLENTISKFGFITDEANRAQSEADRAEDMRDETILNAHIASDVQDGLDSTSATEPPRYFRIFSPNDEESFIYYRHDPGPVATELKRYPSSAALEGYFKASGVRTEDSDERDEYVFAVCGNDYNAPWGIHRTGVVRQPRISTDVINNMGIEEVDEFSGYVFGVHDKNNNSPLALRADGTVRAPRIELEYINGEPVRDFLTSDNNSIPASTQEWWIGPVHTFLREPYERIVSGMYGEEGQIYVCEHIPGAGVISRYEIGRTPTVDDHNAPALYAESGRRFIAVWSRHGTDDVMRIRVSDVRGDLASFNDIAEQNLIVPGGYTYAQVYKITHLSDAAQDTFWVFGRSSQNGWGYTQLSVDQASGEISAQEWVHLFRGVGYLAFADGYTEGEQRIRVAMGHNPASDVNYMYYMEIDCVSGDMILPPASAPVGNIFSEATLPVALGQAGATISQTSSYDRRLFYARPGPQGPAILYAEWPVDNPDGAVYKLASLVEGTWVVRDHGNVGSRIGYVESANYLAGGSFPDPCFDDVLYLASHDDATGISTLLVHRTVGGITNIRPLSETSQGRIIRPISPKGGSPYITYGLVTDYGFSGPFSFRGSIKFQTIGGNL